MDAQRFEAQLRADGYSEIEIKEHQTKAENNAHAHDCSVRGLVLNGTFIVRLDGQQVTFGPGEVFEVGQGVEHTEEVGPDGARLLVGKKY